MWWNEKIISSRIAASSYLILPESNYCLKQFSFCLHYSWTPPPDDPWESQWDHFWACSFQPPLLPSLSSFKRQRSLSILAERESVGANLPSFMIQNMHLSVNDAPLNPDVRMVLECLQFTWHEANILEYCTEKKSGFIVSASLFKKKTRMLRK